MQIFLVLALIVAILAVIFALQNPMPITVSLLVWQFEGSLALVLLIALTLGVLISLLVSAPAIIRRSRSVSTEKKAIGDLKSQLAERDRRIEELQASLAAQATKPAEAPRPTALEPVDLPPITPPDVPS